MNIDRFSNIKAYVFDHIDNPEQLSLKQVQEISQEIVKGLINDIEAWNITEDINEQLVLEGDGWLEIREKWKDNVNLPSKIKEIKSLYTGNTITHI